MTTHHIDQYDNNGTERSRIGKNTAIVIVAVASVMVLIAIASMFYTVDSGERGVVTRFGEVVNKNVEAGLHIKMPFIESAHKYNMRTLKYRGSETAASHDLQDIATSVVINYHIDPNRVDKLYTTVGSIDALNKRIFSPAVSNAVKAVTARYDAESLITKRDEVRQGIAHEIRREAESLRVKGESITDDIIRYESVKQWDGVLPKFTGQGALPMIDIGK